MPGSQARAFLRKICARLDRRGRTGSVPRTPTWSSVGAILLGDTKLAAAVKSAVEDRQDFSGIVGSRGECKDVLDLLAEGL